MATTGTAAADGRVEEADAGGGVAVAEADIDTAIDRKRWRIGPLLPARLRPVNVPVLWLEAAIIAVGYYCYRLTQDAATSGRVAPFHRGFSVLRLEHSLHIDVEHWLNHTTDRADG